ncbi:DNA-binding protein [Candidatus Venteria ishoeyi]|uniref:Uncharacterized protein n=1 Tax=Candidatus Venteria ishoeyi TaxID=1899563 RepID=A0A1H6F2D5_9GAMM|nr:DNA-binding protein [Candidatus Venteria ishoeyi]SEH04317.1 Uncharacterised protein [Candidatus Venteria ishoeyi]
MPLIRLDKWREKYFIGNERPSMPDLQRNCKNGTLPAQKICKRWYILVSSENDLTPIQNRSITGNPAADALVNRVLAAGVQ